MNEVDDQTTQYINQDNFAELVEIRSYLTFILKTLKDLNNDPFVQHNSDLQTALNNIFWVTGDINNKISSFFNPYTNQKSVTYALGQLSRNQNLSIPLASLPTNAENLPIFPSSYATDSGIISPKISVENRQLI